MPKVHLKHTYSFDAVLDPKVFQNVPQKDPKMLGRNWYKRAWDPFGHIKPGFWSQRHLPSPSSSSFWPHMEANWTSFSPSASCSDIIAGATLLVYHSAQLLYRSSLFTTYWSEHNLVRILIVHDSKSHARTRITASTSQLPWTHHNWRTCIWNSHSQSPTWLLDRFLLSI